MQRMIRNIVFALLCCGCAVSAAVAQTASSESLQTPDGMVQVPAGKFWMGRTLTLWRDALDIVPRAKLDNQPANHIYLDAFYIDKYEVTNSDYARFLEAAGGKPPWPWPQGKFRPGDEKQAVNYVNWFEADAYCKWAGKRLPTEAEWEKAARGGLDRKPYPWGFKEDAPRGKAAAFGTGKAVAVGQYPPNGYGLYDVAGNVMEWTNDWYKVNYYPFMPKVNPKGPDDGLYRVVRGGGWADSVAEEVATFFRNFSDPELRASTIGFRCAK
jgi:formylglycine-generating enzyme required for sulfatase activity